MFKFLLGALVVVALVGYGVIDTRQIEDAGLRVKTGINSAAEWVKEKTEPTMAEKLVDKVSK